MQFRNNHSSPNAESIKRNNIWKGSGFIQHGRYGQAMQCQSSLGCALNNYVEAFQELLKRHPSHSLPNLSINCPPSLTVDSVAILSLKAFPRSTSPGGSKLRAQHLIDATVCNVSPDAQNCLDQLTILVNKLLAGNLDETIALWLVGALLIALRKKCGGVRTIAVGEVLRRLFSRLPDILLPYGQVGVGAKRAPETAIHSVRTFFEKNP